MRTLAIPKPRILIIDDDAHLKHALELRFEQRNYSVEVAGSTEEALLILRAEKAIEVVLADFMMPALSSLELLGLLKHSTDLLHLAVVVMSHNQNPEFRSRVLQLGADDYISKAQGPNSIVEKSIQTLEAKPSHLCA